MVDERPRGRPSRPELDADLKAARERTGMSLRAAADLLRVPRSTLQRWESKQAAPPPKKGERVLDRLRSLERPLENQDGPLDSR